MKALTAVFTSLVLVGFCQHVYANYTLLLPVNVTLPEGKRVNLEVQMPDNFEPREDIIQTPSGGKMQEFFPKSDKDINRWSEIITVQMWIGKEITAAQKVQQLGQVIERLAGSVEVVFADHHAEETFEQAHVMMIYKNPNLNREELLYAEYLSGPYDCSGYQYSIALSDTMTANDAAKKILAFKQSNVGLIRF